MRIILSAALMAMTACTTAGRPIDHERAAAFVPGKTTYQEVVAALGPPTSSMTAPNGRLTIAYSHLVYRTSPATFIPVVGLFAGGANMQSDTIALTFAPDGVLERGSGQSSDISSRHGP